MHCYGVFTVEFEQVFAGWDLKFIDSRPPSFGYVGMYKNYLRETRNDCEWFAQVTILHETEAVHQRCSYQKVFWKY